MEFYSDVVRNGSMYQSDYYVQEQRQLVQQFSVPAAGLELQIR